MDSELALAKERGLICKAVLDILRAYCRAHLGTDRFGEYAQEVLIGCAVIIGQSEGRPMSASDISDYLGIPRTTVTRKLRSLSRAGAVSTGKDGQRVPVWLTRANDPEVVEEIEQAIFRTLETLTQLTNLVSKKIDAGRPQS